MSLLFSEDQKSLFVRAATFIDRLSQCIEFHITVIEQRKLHALGIHKEYGSVKGMTKSPAQGAKRKQKDTKVSVKDGSTYRTIAIYLMEFLIDRKILNVSEDFYEKESNRVVRGRYTKFQYLYVMCLFDISTLPVKITLPMIVPPVDWRVKDNFLINKEEVLQISDITGGYLIHSQSFKALPYRLLSSTEYKNFYITFKDSEKCYELCNIVNHLQKQRFRINSAMLKFLLERKDVLEEFGLLMPSWLANVEPHIIFRILREDLLETNNKQFKFSTLVKILDKRIQQARYEQLIIRIATAYEGLSFYLPAFLDFRGRIYRTGILNFHERSLIRSLILFDDDPKYEAILSELKDEDLSRMRMYFYCSAASHYKSFYSIKESMEWFSNILDKYNNNNNVKEFIQFSSSGKKPFQFISMFIN